MFLLEMEKKLEFRFAENIELQKKTGKFLIEIQGKVYEYFFAKKIFKFQIRSQRKVFELYVYVKNVKNFKFRFGKEQLEIFWNFNSLMKNK